MSGIFGIISKNNQPISQRWTNSMLESLRHRGPDGARIQQTDGAVLGHLMLHYTPESCFEEPPLVYHHWVITADARLDNRKELCTWLNIPPSAHSRTSDSLLLVKAFEKWGKQCPNYLVGDFAFAIWDKVERSLFCAKDHTGVRQLFFADTPNFFVFSTEVRAIAQLDFIGNKLDLDVFRKYVINLEFEGEDAVNTFIAGIKQILPATWLYYKDHKVITQLYWERDGTNAVKFANEREYGLALRALIQQAIDDRINTNFPVGITLSGGLDSSSIACLAARKLAQSGKNLYSASSVLSPDYKGMEVDERKFIDLVIAQEKNIIPKYISAEKIGVFNNLQAIFDKTYEPVNSFYYMDDALQRSLAPHTRVVLSGYGGDFTASNPGNMVLANYVSRLEWAKSLDLLREMKKITRNSYRIVIQNYIIAPLLSAKLLSIIRKIKGNSKTKTFQFEDCPASERFISKHQAIELHENQQKRLWDRTDHYTSIWDQEMMWFGGEYCLGSYYNQEHAYPLLDKRIIEFLWASPPANFLYKRYKRGYIRRALEGILPNEILWRANKTPYTPDFRDRMLDEKLTLSTAVRRELGGLKADYLNLEYMLERLDAMYPLTNKYSFDDHESGVVNRGFQAMAYLSWIDSNRK